MNGIDKARFMLTLCCKCLGCNQLELDEFLGVKECRFFKKE